MDVSTLVRWQRYLFFILIICIPFTTFPKAMTLPVIGQNLAYYPLLAGGILWGIEVCRSKNSRISKKYEYYFLVFIGWQLLCTIIGFINFKYFDLFDLSTLEKVQPIVQMLQTNGISINENYVLRIVQLGRILKGVFVNNFWTFGAALWVYHLYANDWKMAIRDLKKAALTLICLLGAYSLIEITYFMGSPISKTVLIAINPYLYDVSVANGWWPPLLWNGVQLRSVFQEPSFFGVAAAFLTPLIWGCLFTAKSIRSVILLSLMNMLFVTMIVLTQARTATVLFLGEIGLLSLAVISFYRVYWQRYILTIILSLIGFMLSFGIIMNPTILAGYNTSTVKEASVSLKNYSEDYIDNNVKSAVGNARSNNARGSNNKAMFKVAFQHPILGVGTNLQDGYVKDNLTDFDKANDEVGRWTNDFLHKGVLASGYPITNNFAYIAADFGLIGLVIYLIPFVGTIAVLLYRRVALHNFEVASLLIAFIGSIMAFMSSAASLYVYILLGILLCVIDSHTKRA